MLWGQRSSRVSRYGAARSAMDGRILSEYGSNINDLSLYQAPALHRLERDDLIRRRGAGRKVRPRRHEAAKELQLPATVRMDDDHRRRGDYVGVRPSVVGSRSHDTPRERSTEAKRNQQFHNGLHYKVLRFPSVLIKRTRRAEGDSEKSPRIQAEFRIGRPVAPAAKNCVN